MKNKFVVSGIGELLWDVLPAGKQLGGAPFNFSWHALQAGCESYVISAVGRDRAGVEILDRLVGMNIHADHIQTNEFPTSTVTVQIDKDGHPGYTIHEPVAWDHLIWKDELSVLAGKLDAICFGSLAQRNQQTSQTIRQFISALGPECLKVFDVNLRQDFYDEQTIKQSLAYADILKVNDSELPVLAGYHGFGGDVKSQLRQLLHHYHFRYIAYTMGGKGSILMGADEYSELQAPLVDVVDTVGAGDAFTAVLATGILKGMPLAGIHRLATEVAAFVCTQKGATPELPKSMIKPIVEQK
jgi:fructokinase